MSSKRRIRRRSCTNKRNFPSRKKAKNALGKYIREVKPISFYVVYKCRFANHWHFGRIQERYNRK